jgi:hypothetical protein
VRARGQSGDYHFLEISFYLDCRHRILLSDAAIYGTRRAKANGMARVRFINDLRMAADCFLNLKVENLNLEVESFNLDVNKPALSATEQG